MELRFTLPAKLEQDFFAAVADWKNGKIDRLWARDASLWTNQDESKWLGWLDIVERQHNDLASFRALSQDIKKAGFRSALLLGMGGSSLCPEVLAQTFGRQDCLYCSLCCYGLPHGTWSDRVGAPRLDSTRSAPAKLPWWT